jgi:hypothetical protein
MVPATSTRERRRRHLRYDQSLGDVEGARGATDDGETYRLDFFFAERHRTRSNFRITTNLPPVTTELPTVSVMHD